MSGVYDQPNETSALESETKGIFFSTYTILFLFLLY
jgi:hypothetical protein